jgi:hypothetical protein
VARTEPIFAARCGFAISESGVLSMLNHAVGIIGIYEPGEVVEYL